MGETRNEISRLREAGDHPAALPRRAPSEAGQFWAGTTKGIRIYLATPRLRGLMVMELAVAAAGAMIYVNTVVLVQTRFGLGGSQVALAFAAFGAGSMLAAFLLPRMLEHLADRPLMLAGAGLMVASVATIPLMPGLGALMALWVVIGFGFSLTQTPIGRILNRSARPEDRPAVFAAQFALSHACWLITYPLAGWLGSEFGLAQAAIGLAAVEVIAMAAVFRLWPAVDPVELFHDHAGLAPDHPHLREGHDGTHRHPVMIDGLHPHWPRRTA